MLHNLVRTPKGLLRSLPITWLILAFCCPISSAQAQTTSNSAKTPLAPPVLAPPPTLSPPPTPVPDKEAFAALTRQLAAAKQPPSAVAKAYRQFVEARRTIDPALGITICEQAATLQLSSKDKTAAQQTLATALSRYAPYQSARPILLPLALKQANLYLADKNPTAAVAALRPLRNTLSGQREAALVYANALEGAGPAESRALIDFIAEALRRQPALLAEPGDQLFRQLNAALLREGRTADALRWAKLRFVVCDFTAGPNNSATALVSGAFLAQDLSLDRARAFTVALQDSAEGTARSNPLAGVSLPASFALAAPGNQIPANIVSKLPTGLAPRDRITLLLAGGANDLALGEARKLLLQEATSAAGVLEVCRVLKARSLGLTDPNAFIHFVKTGTGPNPLAPAGKAVTPPAAKPSVPSPRKAGPGTPMAARQLDSLGLQDVTIGRKLA